MHFPMAPLGALIAVFAGLSASNAQAPAAPPNESYSYCVEWRFVRAGEVNLNWTADKQAELKLKTVTAQVLGKVVARLSINVRLFKLTFPKFSRLNSKVTSAEPSALSTGTTDFLKRPSFIATSARCWLTSASASSASRDIPSLSLIHI